MKSGLEKSPHRSLLKAMGLTDAEIERPLIGIANAKNEIIPGHIHLDKIGEAVKAGIRMAGGTPIEFGVIGVCDGIAMHHEGMKYSLASRELIADSIEVMAMAHPFDGLVLIPNCDKIIPRYDHGGPAPEHPGLSHQRRPDVSRSVSRPAH
jgi:dihydroxy-acid dehydratase